MEPTEYCRDVLGRLAPDQLLAIDLLPEQQRLSSLAGEALLQILREVAAPTRAAEAAIPKLMWWRDELLRANQGSARHPAAIALTDAGIAGRLSADAIDALVSVGERELDPPSIRDSDAWFRAAAGEGALLAAAEPDERFTSTPAFEWIGAARRGLCWWRNAAVAAAAGRSTLPLTWLAAYDLNSAKLVDGDLATVPRSEISPVREALEITLSGSRARLSLEVDRAAIGSTPFAAAGRWSQLWRTWRALRRSRSPSTV